MQAVVTGYIYEKVKEILIDMGVSQNAVEQYDTLIISAIVIITAIAAMEIAYRISLFAIRRIVKRRKYNFLLQILKGKSYT